MIDATVPFPWDIINAPSENLVQAYQEASNYESEWLWWAAQMHCPLEREYCLRRALYINPDSSAVRKALTVVRSQYSKHQTRMDFHLLSNFWKRLA